MSASEERPGAPSQVLGPIAKTMELYLENAALQQEACRAIATLAATNDGSSEASCRQVSQALVKAMRNHRGDVMLQQSACGALRSFALDNARNQEILCQEFKAGADIAEAMLNHRGDAELQRKACLVLENFTFGNYRERRQGLNAGADIGEAMHNHREDAIVQKKACDALASPACDIARLKELFREMSNPREDVVHRQVACDALGNFTCGNARNRVILCQELKAGAAIVEAMRNHREDVIGQEYACRALAYFTVGNARNREILCQELKAGADIVEAMQNHREDAIVQEYACRALRNFTRRNARNRKILCQDLNAVLYICMALKTHVANAAARDVAYKAFKGMTSFDYSLDELIVVLQRIDLDTVLDLVQENMDWNDPNMQMQYLEELAELFGSCPSSKFLVKIFEVSEKVIRIMKTNLNNAVAQKLAYSILRELAKDDETRKRLVGDFRIYDILGESMQAHYISEEVLLSAMQTITKISDEGKKRVIDTNMRNSNEEESARRSRQKQRKTIG